jgi:lysozyme
VKVSLTQDQFDLLVDFIFNLEGGRLALSTLLKLLNAGKYDGAAQRCLSMVRKSLG